jgi:hypothetical protein
MKVMDRKIFIGILYIFLSICLFGGAIGSAIYNLGRDVDASPSSSWSSDSGRSDSGWQRSNDGSWWNSDSGSDSWGSWDSGSDSGSWGSWDSASDSGSWGSWDSGSDSGSWGSWDSGSDSGSWDSDW